MRGKIAWGIMPSWPLSFPWYDSLALKGQETFWLPKQSEADPTSINADAGTLFKAFEPEVAYALCMGATKTRVS